MLVIVVLIEFFVCGGARLHTDVLGAESSMAAAECRCADNCLIMPLVTPAEMHRKHNTTWCNSRGRSRIWQGWFVRAPEGRKSPSVESGRWSLRIWWFLPLYYIDGLWKKAKQYFANLLLLMVVLCSDGRHHGGGMGCRNPMNPLDSPLSTACKRMLKTEP